MASKDKQVTNNSLNKARSCFRSLLLRPVDVVYLVYLRVAFGLAMLYEVCRFLFGKQINYIWISPKYHFTYFGFEWVTPWPGDGMYLHFFVLGIAALGMIFGLFYRFFSIVFFLGWGYLFLLEKAQYLNHFYLILLLSFLLTLVPANAGYSVDVKSSAKLRTDFVPFWTVLLFRAQIAIVYFFASLAKMYPDWLQALPAKVWLIEIAKRSGFPLDQAWLAYAMSYGGILFDLLVVPLLLWPRTRIPAFLLSAVFHLSNSFMFNIGIFPWLMLGITPIFFPASWLRSVLLIAEKPYRAATELIKMPGRALAVLIALYFALQLFLPLRHFWFSGSSVWTDEGAWFSWQMMLRSKTGKIDFIVSDGGDPNKTIIFPLQFYLKKFQVHRLTQSPSLVLAFAHFIREEMITRGMEDPQVRVRCYISLNARPAQEFIDPSVDLAKEQDHWWQSYSWVRPEPGPWDVVVEQYEKMKKEKEAKEKKPDSK